MDVGIWERSNGPSPENVGFVLNVAATLAQPADLSVSTSATSATATVGAPVELLSTLSNAGPGSSSAVTATDVVPAGFAISSAVSSGGTCPVAAQTVTCTIANMPAGGSGFLLITATPSASGSYTNSVSVSGPEEDPDPGNNTATASLTVSAASPRGSTQPTAKAETHCVLPSLAGASQKLAARVLPALGCKVGKVSKRHGPRSKGTVISTSPKPGTYASGRTISLVVSLGPRPKRAKKHRPRRKR